MYRERTLMDDNIGLLEQGDRLLEGLDDRAFIEAPVGLLQSGIASHFRHCLDVYDCFLRGIETGLINYDARERDLSCERDRLETQRRIARLIPSLREINGVDVDAPYYVILEGKLKHESFPSASSLGREVQFLLSHTVHHYALVAVILRAQGRVIPPEFGVAPSSLAFWKDQALCAR
jgi:hypothetical protein